MMENPRYEEEKLIEDIRNLFRLKKQIKDIVLWNNKNLSEYEKEEENYSKPARINYFWRNHYIKYKGNGDKNRMLSVEGDLDKIRPYLKDIINDLQKSHIWKIQLTVTITFFSEGYNDEVPVMHSKSDNIKIMIIDEADEIIKKT